MSFGVCIKTIPHSEQRYNTVGDYFVEPDVKTLNVCVSNLNNWKYEALVSVHELVEMILCEARSIKDADITQFDKAFSGDGEPGDAPDAPYRKEHFFATSIERLLAAELGVDWLKYGEAIDCLNYERPLERD